MPAYRVQHGKEFNNIRGHVQV